MLAQLLDMAAAVSHPLLDAAQPHDPSIVQALMRSKQNTALASAKIASLSEVLTAANLEHLEEVLASTTLDDLQRRLSSDRPACLTHMKHLGVLKLGERQALANAIQKAEHTGSLAASAGISYLKPCVWDESDDLSTITVTLLIPAGTTSNQLKVKLDVNSIHVEYLGEATSACGKLIDAVKTADCVWELERSLRPEYDPLVSAAEQQSVADDKLVITLVKATPAQWRVLFTDRIARKIVPTPPASHRVSKAIELKKKAVSPGLDFVPRTFDLGRAAEREARAEHRRTVRQRDAQAKQMPVLSAREHWPSASATLLWREGQRPVQGAPDHPAESGPLYSWVEDAHSVRLTASTRRGLPQSELSLAVHASSVSCRVGGRLTPWCGHLVHKVVPSQCSLTVVSGAPQHQHTATQNDAPSTPDASAAGTSDVCDTLQLTLHKATPYSLWRAPFPELVSQIDLREKRMRMPRRDELLLGDWNHTTMGEYVEVSMQFKASFLEHDCLRVAVTDDALNVHVAGKEDAPMLGGELYGKIDVARCKWRVRSCRPRKDAPSMKIEEIVITLAKAESSSHWRDIFRSTYV